MTSRTPPEPERIAHDPDVRDLAALLQQVHAGVLLCEEVLERDNPGFWTRKKHRGETPALRNACGQLSVAWINLGHWLVRAGVESWTIAPLVTRSTDGGTTQLEFGPDGGLEVGHDAV